MRTVAVPGLAARLAAAVAIACAAWIVLSSPPVSATTCTSFGGFVSLRGYLAMPSGASARGICVEGTHAYIAANDSGLLIVDVSDLTRPVLVGRLPTPRPAVQVQVSANVAYVCCDSSLIPVDVSDPANPVRLALPPWIRPAKDVAIQGTLAYVVTGSGMGPGDWNFKVLDVSDPAHIFWTGTSLVLPGSAVAVSVSGTHAAVCHNTHNVSVVDLTNPTAPVLKGTCSVPDYAFDAVVDGNFIYVAGGTRGLQVIDISDPAAPVVVASLSTSDLAHGIKKAGHYLYVSTGYNQRIFDAGLEVIDVADPRAPVITAHKTLVEGWDVAVQGNSAFVADNTDLSVVNISSPFPAPVVGTAWGPRDSMPALDIAVEGTLAYAALRPRWGNGVTLGIYDFGNPASPVRVGSVGRANDHVGWSVAVRDSLACVGSDSYLRVVNVKSPSAPVILTDVSLGGGAMGIAMAGSRAFVAGLFGNARVYDLSDPSNPRWSGSFSSRGMDIEVRGDYAYLARGADTGIEVFDISDPDAPASIGRVLGESPSHAANALTLDGNTIYVVGGPSLKPSWLEVVDVSVPSAPVRVGVLALPRYAERVVVHGGFAYVDAGTVVQVVDVTDPSAPRFMADFDQPDDVAQGASGMAVLGDYLVVSPHDPTGGIDARYLECSAVTSVSAGSWPAGRGAGLVIMPNPARSGAAVQFAFEVSRQATLDVLDVSGRRVRRLAQGLIAAGPASYRWDGRDDAGRAAGSGVYFVRLSWADGAETGRLILLR